MPAKGLCENVCGRSQRQASRRHLIGRNCLGRAERGQADRNAHFIGASLRAKGGKAGREQGGGQNLFHATHIPSPALACHDENTRAALLAQGKHAKFLMFSGHRGGISRAGPKALNWPDIGAMHITKIILCGNGLRHSPLAIAGTCEFGTVTLAFREPKPLGRSALAHERFVMSAVTGIRSRSLRRRCWHVLPGGARPQRSPGRAALSAEDCAIQSMPDASPVKWHLAHTSWFFESLILARHAPAIAPFDPRFAYLFNSYYEALGPRHPRPRRGLLTRPSLDDVMAYRAHVDAAMEALLAEPDDDDASSADRTGPAS